MSGGPRVGFGHLGRCLGLAEAFSDLGWEVVFRRPPDPLAAAYIARRGFSLGEGPDGWTVGVFDHPTPLHPEILSGVPVGVLVDDFGASRLLADLVVYPPTDRVQQLDWTDARGRCLAGFPYALLRREFQTTPPQDRRFILVAPGGSDAHGLASEVTSLVRRTSPPWPVALLAGPGMSSAPREVHVVEDHLAVAEVFASAIVAVVPFGHSVLELAACGTPALVLSPTPATFEDAEDFCRHGTAVHVSEMDSLPEALGALLHDAERREALSRRGRELVDGRGAWRVAEAVEELVG